VASAAQGGGRRRHDDGAIAGSHHRREDGGQHPVEGAHQAVEHVVHVLVGVVGDRCHRGARVEVGHGAVERPTIGDEVRDLPA
jgi:hypothetical protein